MERKIGEIFKYNGEWYQCIVGCHCPDCAFCNNNCEERERITLGNKLTKEETTGFCTPEFREDGKSVIFKKLEKVGEPYGYFVQGAGIIMVQEYILANSNYIWDYNQGIVIVNCPNERVTIEIKQTKEDMEENKLNLKPFDIQKAREGKPVCTRDGRKVRIICFDAIGYHQPIIALVTNFDGKEDIETYYLNGRFNDDINDISDYDLMMFPEKRTGWINVYNSLGVVTFSHNPYDTREEAIQAVAESPSDRKYYVDTIKIYWEE